MQWRIVGKDGIIVEVMEVVGVEGSRVLFERYLPLHDTVLKRYRVARQDLRAVMAEQLPQWPLCCRLGACDRQGENREGAEERQGLRAVHGDGRFYSTGESSLLF